MGWRWRDMDIGGVFERFFLKRILLEMKIGDWTLGLNGGKKNGGK